MDPTDPSRYGRDRRRRLGREEALELYTLAEGLCQRCGERLESDWHQAHLTAYSNGGATSFDNMEAWCPSCNLGLGAADVVTIGDITPRLWQSAGLESILARVYQKGYATLWAGMGSGKTIFSAFVFKRLLDAGFVERLIFVVPNRNLVDQVVGEYGRLGIHLDSRPRDGVIEHPDTRGAVVTYQSLPRAAGAHATRLDQVSTLVIFDEVHHLADGDDMAWGRAATTMVGDITQGGIAHARCVLNMTGTLFRSTGRKRISTVEYDTIADDSGAQKIQATADHRVPMADLVGRELRAPDVYVYGTDVRLLDLEDDEVIEGRIADLDDQQRSVSVRGAFLTKDWIRGFCTEAMTLLRRSLEAIDHREPLKILYVAHNQAAAKRAADIFNDITGQNFARLVISDEPGALDTLRAAKRERQPCAIVTVAMVTEGFDCPQVAVEAYASNKVADLFVAQAGTRTMRVTSTERADQRMLPAVILIPDFDKMRKAFGRLLAQMPHTFTEDESQAGAAGGGDGAGFRMPRYELIDANNPLLHSTNVLSQEDGELLAHEFDHYLEECQTVGIPQIYAPRVGVVGRRNHPLPRVYDVEQQPEPALRVTTANPREMNLGHRARITKVVGWMQKHLDHDNRWPSIGMFQWQANEAANIGPGGRPDANNEQLSDCCEWMIERVQEHCRDLDERPPEWARPEHER